MMVLLSWETSSLSDSRSSFASEVGFSVVEVDLGILFGAYCLSRDIDR